jgi:hypothetical protein
MRKTFLTTAFLVLTLNFFTADLTSAEVIRGGATLGTVSPVVKISRQGNNLDTLAKGDILYVFTEKGEPVSQIKIKDIFSDVIISEDLPNSVANQVRITDVILVFSNLREYGDFLEAHQKGTESGFRQFASRYPNSELKEEAVRVADGIVYRSFKLRGTAQAFEEFIEEHHGNYYVENARIRRDALIFLPFRSADQLSGYREFIRQNPDNVHVKDARDRMAQLMVLFDEVSAEHVAKGAGSLLGKRVKFYTTMHSVLPIYVEGTSVGKKTPAFKSPRNSTDYLNFQVRSGDIILWRLFANRENPELTKKIQLTEKGSIIKVYGQIFSAEGNAPWIDVLDVEFEE